MKFTIDKDVPAKTDPKITWVEAGEYNVVRLLDDKRVIIELPDTHNDRLITIVGLSLGQLAN